MDYEKYIKIKEKHGKESSWAIWSRMQDTNTSNMEDLSFFDDKNISAEKFAESIGTISYEILTALSKRIKRVVLN